jgi:hypothetical protein
MNDNKDAKIDRLKVQFSRSKLLTTFPQSSKYANRSIIIKGEALDWGFDAYPDSMVWAKPHKNEIIDAQTKREIMDEIITDNYIFTPDFKIIVNWSDKNV